MVHIACKVDTGVEVNVISKGHYDRLNPNPRQGHLGPKQYKITAHGGYTIKTFTTRPLYVHQHGSIRAIIS